MLKRVPKGEVFNLDTNTYAEGALPVKTKEMLGLVASMVLRCDDCVRYHLQECHRAGVVYRTERSEKGGRTGAAASVSQVRETT